LNECVEFSRGGAKQEGTTSRVHYRKVPVFPSGLGRKISVVPFRHDPITESSEGVASGSQNLNYKAGKDHKELIQAFSFQQKQLSCCKFSGGIIESKRVNIVAQTFSLSIGGTANLRF
jgi:hypothetical protein